MNHRLCNWAWPFYDCELCVGQEYWQGCYCAYYEADGPCSPYTPLWRMALRYLWNWMYRNRISGSNR